MSSPNSASTADAQEIANFTRMAEQWWDPRGKFRPLHQINPLRTQFVVENAAKHFGLDRGAEKPLSGLDIIDVGCGGGILSEQMAALGGNVTGIDAGGKNIEIAKVHAKKSGLDINYQNVLPEDMALEGKRFDIVLNMEIIEHVSDTEAFMAASAKLLKDNGVMVLSTLNRTIKSFLLAKIGAEYILRWLPVGTHNWDKFLKPSELAHLIRPHGLEFTEIEGVIYNPLNDSWAISKTDLDVNYMAFAVSKK